MVAGRVYHWKHGWIPLDAVARAQVAQKGGTKTKFVGPSNLEKIKNTATMYGYDSPQYREAVKRFDPAGQSKPIPKTPAKPKSDFTIANPKITLTSKKDTRTDEVVEGVPDVQVQTYHKVAERFTDMPSDDSKPAAWTKAQKIEAARDVQEFLDAFPGLKDHKQRIYAVHSNESFMGETSSDGFESNHDIALDTALWNNKKIEEDEIGPVAKERHFGIPTEADTADEYRRRAIAHEMGHVLHLQSEDDDGLEHFDESGAARNELNRLANEMVTPRQMGFTDSTSHGEKSAVYQNGSIVWIDPLDEEVPRWAADSLDHQSAYGMGSNRYEWLAEAIIDGYFNGDKASDAGKRALKIAKKLYGKESSQ